MISRLEVIVQEILIEKCKRVVYVGWSWVLKCFDHCTGGTIGYF